MTPEIVEYIDKMLSKERPAYEKFLARFADDPESDPDVIAYFRNRLALIDRALEEIHAAS